MDGAPPALTLVVALAVGILMQSASRHLRVPGIVLLLVAGAGLGPDGLGDVVHRLLATDRALTREDSAAARQRMLRSVEDQPYLRQRIAGGVMAIDGAQTYSKTGTWGPIYADAGIVRDSSGRQFVIAFFTDAGPPYRGDAIARITSLVAIHLFTTPPARNGDSL